MIIIYIYTIIIYDKFWSQSLLIRPQEWNVCIRSMKKFVQVRYIFMAKFEVTICIYIIIFFLIDNEVCLNYIFKYRSRTDA